MLLTTRYSWICKSSQITCICSLERASTLTASCLLLQLARRQAGGTLNDAERKPNNSFPIGFSMVWTSPHPTANHQLKEQKAKDTAQNLADEDQPITIQHNIPSDICCINDHPSNIRPFHK